MKKVCCILTKIVQHPMIKILVETAEQSPKGCLLKHLTVFAYSFSLENFIYQHIAKNNQKQPNTSIHFLSTKTITDLNLSLSSLLHLFLLNKDSTGYETAPLSFGCNTNWTSPTEIKVIPQTNISR